jgi:hypothetical protein
LPGAGFYIHHLIGWNETDTAVRYRQDWGRTTQGDHYANGKTYYSHKLDVGVGNGRELFLTHYSLWHSTRAVSATVTPTISRTIATSR